MLGGERDNITTKTLDYTPQLPKNTDCLCKESVKGVTDASLAGDPPKNIQKFRSTSPI